MDVEACVEHVDFEPFIQRHPAMWMRMNRYGWTTVEALRDPEHAQTGARGWNALAKLPGVGARKILDLVNFLRDRGTELPWFADWDKETADWEYLEGRRRAEPR